MSDPAPLEALTRLVAEEVDGRLPDERLATQRRVVVELATGARRAARRKAWIWIPATAAAVAAMALFAVGVSRPSSHATRFWVDAETAPRRPGAFLRAGAQRPLQVQFDSGSRLELRPGSTARMSEATRSEVRITLLDGEARSTVRGQVPGGWTVEAGPYDVTALGTEFVVRWSAGRHTLDVVVSRGKVVVEGGGLDARGVQVRASQELHVEREGDFVVRGTTPRATFAEVGAAPVGGTGAPASAPALAGAAVTSPPAAARAVARAGSGSSQPRGAPTVPAAPTPPEEPTATEPQAPAAAARPIAKWRQAHLSGDYGRAVAEAERAGLSELLRTLPADELRQLADAARYANQGAIARRALLAVRERFPGTAHARIAAYLLGRIADEMLAHHASAATWFETYLREDPEGALAEEALGRCIDAYRRAGNAPAARATARRYLELHPRGVFAPVARAALQ
jgi:ferric-dicitrate binding protein FerR (iron transport regulator)